MGALSIPELESLHDDFSQANMVAGMSPHFVEKEGEEKSTSYLAPEKTSELLKEPVDFSYVPKKFESDVALRLKAHEVARQIDQITDVDAIPILGRFVGGLDLDRLDKRDTLADVIAEKVAILSIHKIVELIEKNGGSVEYDLPEQVTSYLETIREIKEVMYRLATLSETHKILEYPLQEVVEADTKWKGQDEMEEAVKSEEMTFLASRIFRIIAGNDNKLKRGINYSELWTKEGLDTVGIPRLSSEQVARFLKIGVRYFTWYSLLDEKWQGEAEDNYLDDFQEVFNTFKDARSPNHLGNLIPRRLNDSIVSELVFTDTRLFVEEAEDQIEL